MPFCVLYISPFHCVLRILFVLVSITKFYVKCLHIKMLALFSFFCLALEECYPKILFDLAFYIHLQYVVCSAGILYQKTALLHVIDDEESNLGLFANLIVIFYLCSGVIEERLEEASLLEN